ncbi:MAG: putative peptide modification system cyclase [Rudaea sp.]
MSEIQTDMSSGNGHARPESVLRAIAICDLVNSTALIEQLGDRKGAEFMQQLDRFSRDLLQRHRGREIDKTDGFLLLFDRPVQAVAFAMEYQRLLRELGELEFLPLKARIGIHVGDVLLWENSSEDIARGAKPVEVEGIAKPVAARLMHLALPGQILLSGVAQALIVRAQADLEGNENVEWKEHGRYRFKGVAEPLAVYEVGERNIAPMAAPAPSGKAYREVPWWRRRTALAIEISIIVASVGALAYFGLRSPDAIAFAKRDWIVVGDLVNATGESILNDSLLTAFRIGLEQSRYVNIVSDLKVRSTLELMQRDADKTRIDRTVGSELAIRDGARALVLPTVAEVGGRVRVTAEVIDPHSRATVYTETAEGVGFSSVLPSLDKVGQQLRVRLGEALSSVQADNAPLPLVTTSNLDALRAYALGLQAYANSHDSDALELFKHAVKLDANFALAYTGIARVYEGDDDSATAYTYVEKALALRDRLPARDQLYLDAWAARRGPPGPMLEKWKLLAKLYPDYYAASYNYAFFSWQMENRAADAITAIEPALSVYDPQRAAAYYTLGYILTAENRFEEAEKSFRVATSISSFEGAFYGYWFAAQRRFDDAVRVLDRKKPTGIPTSDVFISRDRAGIAVDQGNWDRASAMLRSAQAQAEKIGPPFAQAYRAMSFSVDDYTAKPEETRPALHAFVDELRASVLNAGDVYPEDALFMLAFSAYLAERGSDAGLAAAALDTAAPKIRGNGYVNLENMLAVARSARLVHSGKAKDAIAELEKLVDGSELYLTHVALVDAYSADGRPGDALKQTRWLAAHRGRAYLEINCHQILQTRYIAESNLAELRAAEIQIDQKRADLARKDLADFMTIWPVKQQPAAIATRTQDAARALNVTIPD